METVTLLYEDYQKELAEDFKNTFLKRASDTDSSRSNDAVIDEVTDMLSTNIAVYTEKLLQRWGFSSGGEGGGGGDVTVTLDDLLKKYLSDNYVTIKGDQEVFGEKDFRKGIRIAGRRLYWDEGNDALVIEGAAYTTRWLSAKGVSPGGGGAGSGGAAAMYQLIDVSPNDTKDAVLGAEKDYVLTFDGNFWRGMPNKGGLSSKLFTALDKDGNEVNPDDENSEIYAIRANYSLWSVGFLSAKGISDGGAGGGGGGAVALYQLLDVEKNSDITGVAGATKGSVLTFNGDKWYADKPKTAEGINRLFSALDADGNEVDLNDESKLGTITNIRANYALWSVDWISAKGKSSGGSGGTGGASALYQLVDVLANDTGDGVDGAVAGKALVFDGTYWKAADAGLNESQLSAFLSLNGYLTQTAADGRYVTSARKVIAGTGLSGGGSLTSDVTLSLGTSGVVAGTYTKVMVDVYGRVTSGTSLSATDIPSLDWSKITTGKPTTLAGYGITDAYSKTEADGKYVTIATAQTISGAKTFSAVTKTASVLPSADANSELGGTANRWNNIYSVNGTFSQNVTAKLLSASETLQIGDAYLKWDSTNNAVYVIKKDGTTPVGFYSTDWLSAKGVSMSGVQTGTLADPTDVEITNPTNGQALKYDAISQKWVNGTIDSFNVNQMWAELKKADSSKIIDASHIPTSVLDGRWVKKTGDTMTGDLTMSNTNAFNIGWGTRVVRNAGPCIHGGTDTASSTDANLRFGSWNGIGWYPTISGQTVAQGKNAMWLNVRTGVLNVAGGIKESTICIGRVNSAGNYDGAYNGEINRYDHHLFLQHHSGKYLIMCTGGGLAGIGTDSPRAKLDVAGNVYSTGFFYSTVGTGTAPYQCSSTTLNTNLNADMLDNWHLNFLPRNYNIGRCYAVRFALGGEDNGWKKIFACSESGTSPYRSVTVWGRIWYAHGNYAQSEVWNYHFCAIFYMRSGPSSSDSSVGNVENSARLYLPTFAKGMDNIRLVRVGTNNFELQVRQISSYHNANIEYQYWSYGCNVSAWENLQSTSNTSVAVSARGASTLADSRASSADVWTSARTFYIQDHNAAHTGTGISVNGSSNVYLKLPNSIQCGDWFRSTGNSGWYHQDYGGGWYMQDSTYIRNYGSKRLRIQTDTYDTLQLVRSSGSGGSSIAFYNGGGTFRGQFGMNATSWFTFDTGTATANQNVVEISPAGGIHSKAEITAKASGSDIRLKKDIQNYNAMDIINKFRSVKYHWNDVAKANSEVYNNDYDQFGLIAQDLIAGGFEQWVRDVFHDYYTVTYERLIPVVWKGLQEVDDEVTKLRKEVVRLNKRISELEKFLCA